MFTRRTLLASTVLAPAIAFAPWSGGRGWAQEALEIEQDADVP